MFSRIVSITPKRSLSILSVAAFATYHNYQQRNHSLCEESRKGDRLRKWEQNIESGATFRKHPNDIEPDRRVILLVGITGGGKSSTANTLTGKSKKTFRLSDSVVSETSAVTFRDYNFMELKWRVIDTPGLGDTNASKEDTMMELEQLYRFAKHGVSAIVVVIPKGRLTEEHAQTVKKLLNLFGDDAIEHMVIAMTKCKQRRDALLDDINRLPFKHFLRQLVERLEYRIVPVENIIMDKKYIARLQLHQRIVDVLDRNDDRTLDLEYFRKHIMQEDIPVKLETTTPVIPECHQSWSQDEKNRWVFTLQCTFPEDS